MANWVTYSGKMEGLDRAKTPKSFDQQKVLKLLFYVVLFWLCLSWLENRKKEGRERNRGTKRQRWREGIKMEREKQIKR